jgi:hypothetical protein
LLISVAILLAALFTLVTNALSNPILIVLESAFTVTVEFLSEVKVITPFLSTAVAVTSPALTLVKYFNPSTVF